MATTLIRAGFPRALLSARHHARTLRFFSDLPKPSKHVASQNKDVWSIVNEAAASVEAATGTKVVNLGQGFFSYSPPGFAIEAAKKALDQPLLNQYAPTRGMPILRQELAKSYSESFKRELDWETEILITAGANEGMYAAFTAFLEEGQEVIVFEPFFDQYLANITLPGGVVRYVPMMPPKDDDKRVCDASEWTIDFDLLEKTINEKTKMIVLNTPHNPVGKVLSEDELGKIAEIAVRHNLVILSDEVYDRLYYKPFHRIATVSPEAARLTLTVGSAGKTFAATGWRVGWLIGHPDMIKYVAAAHTRIVFTVNTPFQYATASAFAQSRTNTYFDDTVDSFRHKFSLLSAAFDKLGLPYTVPEGGYFLLVNFAKVQLPLEYEFPPDVVNRHRDFKLAYWLIKEFGVVAIPPTDFYSDENKAIAENYLRFAVCKDDELLVEAGKRLAGLKDYIK